MPIRPNRNMYLAFLSAWDQFQAFRKECETFNATLQPGAKRMDPIRDFTGINIDKVRQDTAGFVTSTRSMNPSEILIAFEHLGSTMPPLIAKRHTGDFYTFGGQEDNGERLGANLNRFRPFLQNPENYRWWPALVVLAVMQDGVPRYLKDHLSRCGLEEKQFLIGVNQLKRGFTVVDWQGASTQYKAKLVKTDGDKYRLPDSILFHNEDSDIDAVLPGEPGVPGKKIDLKIETDHFAKQVHAGLGLPAPDSMHGAADEFAGTDDAGGGMHAPSAQTIRDELKKLGMETGGAQVPPKAKGNGDARPHHLEIPISKEHLDLLRGYLQSKNLTPEVVLEAHLLRLVVEAEDAQKSSIKARLAELEKERQRLLAQLG